MDIFLAPSTAAYDTSIETYFGSIIVQLIELRLIINKNDYNL
jgi:hypothetical protein